jgi:hypothetical protein
MFSMSVINDSSSIIDDSRSVIDDSRSVIDDSRSVIEDARSVIDDSRVRLQIIASFMVVIYDHHILILQATGPTTSPK